MIRKAHPLVSNIVSTSNRLPKAEFVNWEYGMFRQIVQEISAINGPMALEGQLHTGHQGSNLSTNTGNGRT